MRRIVRTFAAAACSLAVGYLANADASLAQDAAWTNTVVTKVMGTQMRPACFQTPQFQRSLHIIGGDDSPPILETHALSRLINQLAGSIRSNTPNQVTQSNNFHSIATASPSIAQDKVDLIQRMIRTSERAELTVLVRPVRTGNQLVQLEIDIWALDDGDITCTETISTQTSISGAIDPRCATAWSNAAARNTPDDYEGFIFFFEDCPQSEEALARLERLAEDSCPQAWETASARNSLDSYEMFLREHGDCRNEVRSAQLIVSAMRQQARQNSQPQPPVGSASVQRRTINDGAITGFVTPEPRLETGRFVVHIASYSTQLLARENMARYESIVPELRGARRVIQAINSRGRVLYRTGYGYFPNSAAAEQICGRLRRGGESYCSVKTRAQMADASAQ